MFKTNTKRYPYKNVYKVIDLVNQPNSRLKLFIIAHFVLKNSYNLIDIVY